MKMHEAVTMHSKSENWERFPVFVWEEGNEFVTDVDGQIFRAGNPFGLDSRLSEAGIPAPRNLYLVDDPAYEN